MKKIVLSLFLYSITAYAAPEGFELISGQATPPRIDSQGQIYIQSTQDSIVHWNSFSLNPQEVLIFDQAQETSSILNRIVGSDPSEILGKLQSNGMVYLINQNGILIGPSGVIETAGFLASTLDVLTSDFFTKNTLEFFSENPGTILNLGKISCPIGQITLLARNIENQGEINGSLQAVACTKATLQIDNQRVFIQTNQELDTPENLKTLHTSLQKNPYAHAIKHSGRITANTLGTQEGRVYLFAQKGTTKITGNVEASDIQLLGKEVLLKEQAIIDASSDTQGGKVFIGGSYKGQDHPLAEHVLIDSQAQIHADARQTGDGGKIIIWSEANTEFLGSLSAKGGALSGDGGFVEVSGRKGLTFEGLVDLTAAKGKTGNLLIDPDNITIISTGTDPATGQTFNTPGDVDISGANIGTAINTANLILQANQNIIIEDDITATTAGNGLTLQAGGSITTSGVGPFTISLNGGSFNATFNSSGPIPPLLNSASFIGRDLTINTNGGDIIIQQGNLANFFEGGIFLSSGSSFNTGTGSLELTINPNNNLGNAAGINLRDSTIIAGDVVLNGTGNQGGIILTNSIITAAGINATGIANASGAGIQLINSSALTANTGAIIVNAQAANSSGMGISLSNTALINAVNNSVTLNSSLGSIELNDAVIFCGGPGVLTVNSQADLSLLANTRVTEMLVANGVANFTIGRDLTLISGSSTVANAIIGTGNANLTGGSLQFTVGRNVSLTAANSQSYSLVGYGSLITPSNVTGDILFNHVGGDLVLQGANSGLGVTGVAQIGHMFGGVSSNILNGNISLLVDGSISVIGGSSSASSYAQIGHGTAIPFPFTTTGQLIAIAGKDIIMQSNAGSANIINKGGNVTLVTDNLFPTSPFIGPGFFSINSTLSASEELRIYTAIRSQNQINDLINGAPFIPGTLFVDTSEEKWAIYYPGGSYGGGPFTIYYKDGTIEAIEDTFQFAVDQAELSDLLPMVNPPIYQAKLDYFSQRELMCFDPYRRVLRYRTNQKNLTR
jgi:filamentous hemagglutinin family protein